MKKLRTYVFFVAASIAGIGAAVAYAQTPAPAAKTKPAEPQRFEIAPDRVLQWRYLQDELMLLNHMACADHKIELNVCVLDWKGGVAYKTPAQEVPPTPAPASKSGN